MNWERLVAVLKAPHLGADPRFKTNPDRMQNRTALVDALTEILKQRSSAEWLKLLDEAGLPVGPVASVPEMLQDPQTIYREMVVETAHPKLGKVKSLGFPIKFSATAAEVKRSAPMLGEHNREVLEEYGYGPAEIEKLLASRALGAG